ncbi:MAG: MBG-2 domain-containing protein, partial [Oceanospirillaceae bacterium]|nr:MBG-2 domain-containing protein [Oceanospirillaceae bacterium]
MNFKLSLVLLILIIIPWNAFGQFATRSSEKAINTTTANDQKSVRVSTNAEGKVAVVWESQAQDGDGGAIVFKVLNTDGTTFLSETVANSTTTGNQSFPDITFADNGNIIITWMSEAQDGDGWGIYHRIFNSSGTAQIGETVVNTTTAGEQRFPRIGADKDGNYTITWESEGEVKAQRFASDGTTLGSEVSVNTNTTNSQMYPAIDVAKNGEYIIAWQSDLSTGDFYVHAQLFDATGATVNNEFKADSVTSYLQIAPSVAMDTTGNFVVTWSSYGQDGDNYGVYGRLFESNGAVVDDPFKVNTTTANAQTESSVTMSEGGVFLVAWSSYGQDGDNGGVYLQAYSPEGVAKGSETLVNTRTTDFQIQPDLDLHGDLDDLIVVWQDGEHASTTSHDGSGYGVYFQQYEMEDITDPVAIAKDINAYLDATGSVTVAAADVDNGSTDLSEITLSLDQTDFDCDALGDNSGVLKVTDANGNYSTAGMTITVLDTITPTVLTQDITLYLDEAGTVSFTKNDIDNGSSDNCSFTLSLDKTAFTNSDLGDNTVTLTATDDSGNSRSAQATVTVAKGTQTITFNALSAKTYGDASFSLGATASSGLDVSYTSSDTDVATISGSTLTIIGAGATTITASQAGDDNYVAANNVQQTLTVNKMALTITADAAQSKVFGSVDPAFTYSITSGSLVGGDELSGSLTREAGSDVNDYAIQQGTLTAGDNYMINFVSDDFSITQKMLTVTADESQSKVYGDSDPVFAYTLTSGSLESGDGFSGTLSRSIGEDAGDYGITVGTLTAGSNYSINFISKDFSITQKGLTATADDKSKTYGAANPTLTITYAGFVNGDDATDITEPSISTIADATSSV